jgi:hypothetical protein
MQVWCSLAASFVRSNGAACPAQLKCVVTRAGGVCMRLILQACCFEAACVCSCPAGGFCLVCIAVQLGLSKPLYCQPVTDFGHFYCQCTCSTSSTCTASSSCGPVGGWHLSGNPLLVEGDFWHQDHIYVCLRDAAVLSPASPSTGSTCSVGSPSV